MTWHRNFLKCLLYAVKRSLVTLSISLSPGEAYLVKRYAAKNRDDAEVSPIFIIGAPRCGSTLLYQLMTDYFDLFYFTNLHALFYRIPVLVECLIKPSRWRRPSDYVSVHGKTRGLTGPSECGAFWYRFFKRKPQYATMANINRRKLKKLKRVVHALINVSGDPFVSKNLNCALRLQPLNHVFPNSLFIVIRREILDNAYSILKGRKMVYGDYGRWWSLEPPDVSFLRTLAPHEQAVEQIRAIYRTIDSDLAAVDSSRFVYVDYQELCNDPNGVMEKIELFTKQHGLTLNRRASIKPIPAGFEESKPAYVDRELWGALKKTANTK